MSQGEIGLVDYLIFLSFVAGLKQNYATYKKKERSYQLSLHAFN